MAAKTPGSFLPWPRIMVYTVNPSAIVYSQADEPAIQTANQPTIQPSIPPNDFKRIYKQILV